jgi:hypothetical protein
MATPERRSGSPPPSPTGEVGPCNGLGGGASRSPEAGNANLPGLSTAALFLLLVSTLLPATTTFELLPFWDLDPTVNVIPSTGLQPVFTIGLVALTTLAAALALLAAARRRERLRTAQLILAGLGAAGILIHGFGQPATSAMGTEHLIHAAPWLAFAAAWIASVHLCRDARLRAITLALLAALAFPMIAKGLHQLLVEHPATLASFNASKEQTLASRGWAPGSPNALAYERRLVQSEASAWFGLTNVAATFAAATTAGLLTVLASALFTRRAPGAGRGTPGSSSSSSLPAPQLLTLVLTTLAAAAFLVLTKSKGGLGAAAIALGAAAALALASRIKPALARRLAPALGPAVIAAVLALVAIRGVLGESLPELSLLFRSQYAVGALRIWADNPIAGVGPALFQDAYAFHKPPLSPETVQSPHSAMLDWTATLGLFGLAWAAWLVWQATRAAPQLIRGTEDPSPTPDRDTVRLTALTVALVSLASIFVARELATPEFALMRVAALGAWLAGAVLLLPVFVNARNSAVFSAVASLALLAHIQIEVTPVWTNAAPLLGVFLGVTLSDPRTASVPAERGPGASLGPSPSSSNPLPSLSRLIPALATLVLALVVLAFPARTAWRWQTALADAAEIVRPAAQARTDLESLLADPDPASQRAKAERLAGRLSTALGANVPPRPDALDRAIATLRLRLLLPAADALDDAIAARPAHAGTTSAHGADLRIDVAIVAPRPGEGDSTRSTSSTDGARSRLDAAGLRGTVASLDWAAVVHERAAYIFARRGQIRSP